jgi:hypothetical protein
MTRGGSNELCGVVLCRPLLQLDVLVNFGLLGTVFWQWWCMLGGTPPHDVFNLELYNIHVVSIMQSAFAGQYAHSRGAGD